MICKIFFDGLFAEVEKRIDSLVKNGVLNQHQTLNNPAYVLNRILQESTLVLSGIEGLYVNGRNKNIKYATEVQVVNEYIDVVLYENGEEYAFEIKRWQDTNGIPIKSQDIPRLKNFRKAHQNSRCYEIIFTVNDHLSLGFVPDKAFYANNFNQAFNGSGLVLIKCEIKSYPDFTFCIYLAELP